MLFLRHRCCIKPYVDCGYNQHSSEHVIKIVHVTHDVDLYMYAPPPPQTHICSITGQETANQLHFETSWPNLVEFC